jgi:hypothetical protein
MSTLAKFESFLSSAGKLFIKGLGFAVKEAPAASALASLIFPASIAANASVVAGLNLVQSAVIAIEQKYAASGVQTGTGLQKASEVLALSGPAVMQLLTAGGVATADAAYVAAIISAVVGVLNAKAAIAG